MKLLLIILLLLLNIDIINGYSTKRYVTKSLTRIYSKVKEQKKDQTRVRLLIDIKDIGKKGQIVNVSNGMYMNSLGPKKQAEKVSDDEMNKIEEASNEKMKKELDDAQTLESNIKKMNKLLLTRKKGKDGQLFGAVTTKMVIEELRLKFNIDTLSNNKSIMVISMSPKKGNGQVLGGELLNNVYFYKYNY